MSDDPFQILADEITAIRKEVENLQRTSLNKEEAKALHDHVAISVNELRKAAPALESSIKQQLAWSMAMVKDNTATAADESAKGAVISAHAESIKASKKLLAEAADVRRQAWKYFGGLWLWIIGSFAVGGLASVLIFQSIQGRGDAYAFVENAEPYCTVTGNDERTTTEGQRGCFVPYR